MKYPIEVLHKRYSDTDLDAINLIKNHNLDENGAILYARATIIEDDVIVFTNYKSYDTQLCQMICAMMDQDEQFRAVILAAVAVTLQDNPGVAEQLSALVQKIKAAEKKD